MEEAYRQLVSGRPPIVVAPTSYGKTSASHEVFRRAYKEDRIAGGLIHNVPLRSLVKSIYKDHFEAYGGAYQMHGVVDEEAGKSPYFLKELVVSTIDSYLWNLYRIPVAEADKILSGSSMGHYYPILSSMYTAVNVFDEAHLYMDDNTSGGQDLGVASVEAALSALYTFNVHTIIETATMNPGIVREINSLSGGRNRVVTLDCITGSYMEKLGKAVGRNRVVPVKDKEWVDRYSGVRWETRIKKTWDYLLEDMCRDSDDGLVLAVSNTVSGAVRLYYNLRKKCGGSIVLVHGRLSESDRARAESRIRGMRNGIIVSTQVAEAGVDVNSIAVYTEAAPIENIVQRAGRACRRGSALEWCSENRPRVTIVVEGYTKNDPYKPEDKQEALDIIKSSLSGGKTIDWRLPCGSPDRISYADLLVSRNRNNSPTFSSIDHMKNLLKLYLKSDVQPSILKKLLDNEGLCSLFRRTQMTSVAVDVDGVRDFVTVDLEWAFRMTGSIIEEGENGGPVVEVYRFGDKIASGELDRAYTAYKRGKRSCSAISEGVRRDLHDIIGDKKELYGVSWAFRAREGAYKKGIGLGV